MIDPEAPRRGDVWLVSLDPTFGHEIRKTRPAIVVTSNIYNRHNWVILVVPLTSHEMAKYDQVLVRPPEGGLSTASVTLPDQLRSIDRRRLVKRLGQLKPKTLRAVDHSLRIVLDLF